VKQQSLTKLEAICAQADSLHTTQLFFPLLHEFCLTLLPNLHLQDELNRVSKRETTFQEWFDSATKSLPPENRSVYLPQYQGITAFYALNQIKVFFERYDWAYHDNLVKQLKEKGVDVRQLQNEHSELMTYHITGICPGIFPTIVEYRHYMRRIVGALKEELAHNSAPAIATYPFRFDRRTSSLLIGNHEPVKFTRDKNPSVVLGYLSQNGWKSTNWKAITNDLNLENDQIERTIRQINDRVPHPLPAFLSASDHPNNLEEKIVAISPSYKINS